MADNLLYDPELNPVVFYDEDRAATDEFQTKHFEEFPFEERGPEWYTYTRVTRIWQTTDIVYLQFESSFDPIVVSLVDEHGVEVISLPALIGLPHKILPNTWAFEVDMSLAGLETGCYRFKRVLGSGDNQKTQYSNWYYISADPIPGSIFIQYWHDRFFKDVMFESDIKFGIRVMGWIDYDRLGRKTALERYRDERYNPTTLNSKSAKNFPAHFGDEYGLPTDISNIIEQIFECRNVLIDNKPFAVAEGASFEYNDIEQYRLRGLSLNIEPGINRHSRIFSVETDTTKKLVHAIMVDKKVFGDTSNQGSANTTPVLTVE